VCPLTWPRTADEWEAQLREACDAYAVPGHTTDGLVLWMRHGVAPGGFAQAVLRNNLTDAATRADQLNSLQLIGIVQALRRGLPSVAWGSPDRCTAWRARRGLAGAAVGPVGAPDSPGGG
jgi:hypothetical protein